MQTKEYRRKRYLRNKERILAQTKEWAKKNPEKRAEIRKRWKAKNRDKVNYYQRSRFYREKNAVGNHTMKDLKDIQEAWHGMCAYCRKNKADTIDHVTPLTKGGTNDVGNLVPACFSCNSKKGNKSIWAWNFWWAYSLSRIRS